MGDVRKTFRGCSKDNYYRLEVEKSGSKDPDECGKSRCRTDTGRIGAENGRIAADGHRLGIWEA